MQYLNPRSQTFNAFLRCYNHKFPSLYKFGQSGRRRKRTEYVNWRWMASVSLVGKFMHLQCAVNFGDNEGGGMGMQCNAYTLKSQREANESFNSG